MADPTPLDEVARGPKKATVDGRTVEMHPIADQIAAERHEASKKAAKKNGLFRIIRVKFPGGAGQ